MMQAIVPEVICYPQLLPALPIKPLEVGGYADLVLDLTPGTGRGGLIRATSRLEAVLGKTHRTAFERGRRKRELWSDEDPAPLSKERRSETPDLRLCAPVLYSTEMRPLETDRHRLAPSWCLVGHGERSYRKWPQMKIATEPCYFFFINPQYSSARIYLTQFLALQLHGKSP